MQAIILAAGMGKRLKELTRDATKCMIEVNGVTLIERMLGQLDHLNLQKIILVVGYQGEKLRDFVGTLSVKTPIEYVENPIYDKTNNIYSLYLAKDFMLTDDTILLESDLIFDDTILRNLIENPYPSLAVVSKYESWMDGTVVTLNEHNGIKAFLSKKDFRYEDVPTYFKTVNIYKFSREFAATHYVPFLEAYSKALGNNEYYEQVLKVIAMLDKPEIIAMPIQDLDWYEIDDVQDLDIAESIFTQSPGDKLKRIESRYGGYWRYPKLLDFCYLVTPFYPPDKLLDEIKANFEPLVHSYPSGQAVNSLLAAKYFGLRRGQVAVGNGAAELIKALLEQIEGNIGVVLPTFEEYPNRKAGRVIAFRPQNRDYAYTARELTDFFDGKDIDALIVINPDNPSGNYIPMADMLSLAAWAGQRRIRLVVDESFIDFSDSGETMLSQGILDEHRNLWVMKSISKSFGVPGLRLGVLASGDERAVRTVQQHLAIWNINAIGEFFLQIFEKYMSDHQTAMEKFRTVRAAFLRSLGEIDALRVIPSQANFVMCALRAPLSARELTEYLLDRHSIFIKNLSGKNGVCGEYIRLSIRGPEENEALLSALRAWAARVG